MVFFSCNVCNESLKKNQVDKHLVKCRRCEFLSCIDCGKEFWGDSYQSHTKCVSEEEKYSGKNYVAKPNKGEVKQGQWIQKVQAAIQKAPANPQLKSVLQKLEEFPNVPRKKAKFENFLKCSLRVLNRGLVDQVWNLLMAEAQQQNGSSTTTGSESNSSAHQVSGEDGGRESEGADVEAEDTERKLSKRERKELRQKKAHKTEKKDRQPAADSIAAEDEDSTKKKKGKRRKRGEEEEEEEKGSIEEASQVKKKRKGENGVAMETQEAGEENSDGEVDALPLPEKRAKFNWGQIIIAVLQAKGEISVKKLQKKVLAEYASYGISKPEERLEAKFHRKLSRLPNVRVLKDRARLIDS